MLTQEYLKSILHYDPKTGIFTWIKSIAARVKIGDEANYVNNTGYIIIRIKGKAYVAQRLAFLYMTGVWPKQLVDHKDKNRTNNKWKNLREATRSQNQQNRKIQSNSRLGVKGVIKVKNKFKSYICLGTFDTLEEASKAFKKAAKKLHGDFYANV